MQNIEGSNEVAGEKTDCGEPQGLKMEIEMTTVFFLNGKTIGEAASVEAFTPTLKQMIEDGKVSPSEVRLIQAEDRTGLDYRALGAAHESAENERRAKLAPKTLIATDGTALPIAADAVPYASDNGRTNAVRWCETYRTLDGGSITITRDRGINDAIIEWYTI